MIREIYLDGEKFPAIKNALAYLHKRWGKKVSYSTLRNAADREGVIGGGTGERVRVSWKGEEPERGKEEEAVQVMRKGEPLLRYPPGEGPLYDGSSTWK
jgi:hypothetical protein